MFKKLTDSVAKKAANQAKYAAESQARQVQYQATNAVKGKARDFVAKLKKMNKKVGGKIIQSFSDFKSSWEKNAKNPAQSILHFLIAAYNFAHGKKEDGEHMATIILAKPLLEENSNSPTGFGLSKSGEGNLMQHMAEVPEIVRSYLGGTPENDYKLDVNKIVMTIVGEGTAGDDTTIAVQSAGKDEPSSCNLRKNNSGQWKLFNIDSLTTDVKPPKSKAGDF